MTNFLPSVPCGRSSHWGFTLVELLVAMAVLSLLVLMLAQVVTLTSQAIALSSRKLDAAEQARMVFDRLAVDLASRPTRSDLGAIFTKAPGNDSLYFYSEVGGYSGAHRVAAIGYRIQTQQTTPPHYYQLERGAVGTDWGPTAGSNPLIQFLPNTLTIPGATDETNFDVLANGVFRLEFCELVANTSAAAMANPPAPTPSLPNTDLTHVTGLVIALGVLDANSLKILSNDQLQKLSGALPDNANGDDPLSDWTTAMSKPTFAPAGVPSLVVQNIRLYQRIFYVP